MTMGVPDRLPVRRPVAITKGMAQTEGRAQLEIFRRHVDNMKAEVMAQMDMDTNRDIVEADFECITDFYEKGLSRAGTSQVKQRQLAEDLTLLQDLNHATVLRYAR